MGGMRHKPEANVSWEVRGKSPKMCSGERKLCSVLVCSIVCGEKGGRMVTLVCSFLCQNVVGSIIPLSVHPTKRERLWWEEEEGRRKLAK